MDGNKRTALYLAVLLIRRSGYDTAVNPEAMVGVITAVARGEMSLEELASWLEEELILPSNH